MIQSGKGPRVAVERSREPQHKPHGNKKKGGGEEKMEELSYMLWSVNTGRFYLDYFDICG